MRSVCLFVLLFVISAGANCPPEGFDSVAPFDIMKYIRKSWYIQEQMPVSYQPENALFCVVATYELEDSSNIKRGIQVFNYGNEGGVNCKITSTTEKYPSISDTAVQKCCSSNSTYLRALIPDLTDPSKLRVGPAFLQTRFGDRAISLYGDYWVVAVGPNEPDKEYEWAIVSAGPPKVEIENGCRTGKEMLDPMQTNGVGLWLFSRTRVDPERTAMMREIAKDLGFDLSVLRKVQQEGCLYTGARLK